MDDVYYSSLQVQLNRIAASNSSANGMQWAIGYATIESTRKHLSGSLRQINVACLVLPLCKAYLAGGEGKEETNELCGRFVS